VLPVYWMYRLELVRIFPVSLLWVYPLLSLPHFISMWSEDCPISRKFILLFLPIEVYIEGFISKPHYHGKRLKPVNLVRRKKQMATVATFRVKVSPDLKKEKVHKLNEESGTTSKRMVWKFGLPIKSRKY
jgi:hypothetical protein